MFLFQATHFNLTKETIYIYIYYNVLVFYIDFLIPVSLVLHNQDLSVFFSVEKLFEGQPFEMGHG